jgi:hypothetical protein
MAKAFERVAVIEESVSSSENIATENKKSTVVVSDGKAPTTHVPFDSSPGKAVATKATVVNSPNDEIDTPDDELDSPDDEYFDDILNCDGEFEGSDFSDRFEQVNKVVTQPVKVNGINNRHRSSWRSSYNMTYKPPPPHLSFDDPARYLSGELLLIRFRAAASIQSCIRAYLERERFSKLLKSCLVIQSFIRSFLFRRRVSENLKLKRSYAPRKWRQRMIDYAR